MTPEHQIHNALGIIFNATNWHLELAEAITRLGDYPEPGRDPLAAAIKALSNHKADRKLSAERKARRLVSQFFHAYDLSSAAGYDSYQAKIDQLNEWAEDWKNDQRQEWRHEVQQFGAPYEIAGGR